MLNTILTLFLSLAFQTNTTPIIKTLLTADTMRVNWKSINSTGVVMSHDANYSLSGCISQSPAMNTFEMNLPFSLISGFWSSECDINLKNNNASKDFFPLPNSQLVFKLYPTYPNPFKKITTIIYDVPYTSKVTLFIYDISGRQIKQLINGRQEIGRYTISWDGRAENGRKCSAGVYFLSMKTENYKSIKKVLIAK
jgi:hypothetical protein